MCKQYYNHHILTFYFKFFILIQHNVKVFKIINHLLFITYIIVINLFNVKKKKKTHIVLFIFFFFSTGEVWWIYCTPRYDCTTIYKCVL